MKTCEKCRAALNELARACHVCGTRCENTANAVKDEGAHTERAPKVEKVAEEHASATASEPAPLNANGLSRLAAVIAEPGLKQMCLRGASVIEKGHPTEQLAGTVAEVVEIAKSDAGQRLLGTLGQIARAFVEKK